MKTRFRVKVQVRTTTYNIPIRADSAELAINRVIAQLVRDGIKYSSITSAHAEPRED
jgi:hypothetical protein